MSAPTSVMASVAGTSLAAQAESESDAPSQPLPLYTWREFSPDARLWYCKTVSEANDAVNRIRSDSVGFDMEWKPVYVSGQAENRVALVQVADGDHIVLVQVSQMQRTSMNPYPPPDPSYLHVRIVV